VSWDEALFRLAWKLRRGRRHAAAEPLRQRAARLDGLTTSLTLVARALSGEALEIQEAEHVGGYAGEVIYLPRAIHFAPTPEDNARVYLYRVAYAVTSRRLAFTLPESAGLSSDFRAFCTLAAVSPTRQALEAAMPASQTLRQECSSLLLRDHPSPALVDTMGARLEALRQTLLGREPDVPEPLAGLLRRIVTASGAWDEAALHDLWHQFRHGVRRAARRVPAAPLVLWGQLMPFRAESRPVSPGSPQQRHSASSFPGGTELPGKPKEDVRRVVLDQKDIDNDTLIHTFEKIETAEEFSGVTRTPDGADELAHHADALDELDMREVVRTSIPTHSVYRADLRFDDDTGDLESAEPQSGGAFAYDEWDGRAQRYRPKWCTVYVNQPTVSAGAEQTAAAVLRKHARVVHEVRLLLDKLRHKRLLRNRQIEGTDIDVDAVVDRYAAVRGGQRPDDRLYSAQRRQRRDLVTLLLLDMSASTDAWIEGTRVLDIATESALVLGEVLSQWGDRVGMAGFYSNTRRDCRFVMLKPFDADWRRSRAALTGLEPTGYTRIGPAVRHGTALLQGQQAARKLLLLLSDGKPIDYDRYEGRYGIADIRQAIREAHHSRIHTYALAIDVQAKLYLPQMFGSGSFRILSHPAHLVRGLSEVYGQLAR
jgi:nitric oxide reductase NorD protein